MESVWEATKKKVFFGGPATKATFLGEFLFSRIKNMFFYPSGQALTLTKQRTFLRLPLARIRISIHFW